MATKTKWKKKDTKITSWTLHVNTSTNNTVVTLTDEQWNKVSWSWTWPMWYKNSKKSTPYAAEMLTKKILKDAQSQWLKEIWIVIRWVWMARDWVFKAINEIWLVDIKYIKEETPLQFGGCKWKRPKRN